MSKMQMYECKIKFISCRYRIIHLVGQKKWLFTCSAACFAARAQQNHKSNNSRGVITPSPPLAAATISLCLSLFSG